MTVVRSAGQGFNAEDEIVFARTDNAHLDAEFVVLVRFALGNALHFRRMHVVHPTGVGALLLMNARHGRPASVPFKLPMAHCTLFPFLRLDYLAAF